MQLHRDDIVAAARGWIGTPYRHQASLKGVGCDCLGLVRGVWRAVTGEEPERAPPYTRDWAEAASAETLAQAAARHMIAMPLDEFGPGDVLLFRWRAGNPAKHAAIVATPRRWRKWRSRRGGGEGLPTHSDFPASTDRTQPWPLLLYQSPAPPAAARYSARPARLPDV